MASKAMNFKMDELEIAEADPGESAEILAEIEALTDDDLEIVSSKRFTV